MSSQLLYLSAFRGKLVHKPYPVKWICLLHGKQDNDKPNSCLDTPTLFITKQSNKVLSWKLEESTSDALFDGIEIKLLVLVVNIKSTRGSFNTQ